MFRTIGIMTGNSLDAVDTVITEFNNSKITDICTYSQPYPQELSAEFLKLKNELKKNGGSIKTLDIKALHKEYINLIAVCIKELLIKADMEPKDIQAVGFHGQTCYHCPPSIAKSPEQIKTIQLGSGQILANLVNIPVIYDFRSDDILNGGEGAPLAPMHNQHLAEAIGIFPIAFLNAGNTGNIAIVSSSSPLSRGDTGGSTTIGFDVGPCNHFVDQLCQTSQKEQCDFGGKFGSKGSVSKTYFEALFENNKDFYEKAPPKSSDPAWYSNVPVPEGLSFEDQIRTLEYFSAYLFVHALKFVENPPKHYLLFGGGWNNPIILQEFKGLLEKKIKAPIVKWSDNYGFNSKYMEARIMADMARAKLENEPFTYPKTTGCKTPTVCGIIAYPGGKDTRLWSRAA